MDLTKREKKLMKAMGLSVGQILVCIDDDSDDEDLGMSGLVLHGRRDLTIGKQYVADEFSFQHVPMDNTHWPPREFVNIQRSWVMVHLKGVASSCWLKHFKAKK